MKPLLVSFIIAVLAGQSMAAETLMVFTARWCGPCRHFKKDLADDPSIVGDRPVVIVDVKDDHTTTAAFKVQSMPTFVVVDGPLVPGNEKARQVGYDGATNLKKWLNGPR